MRDVIGTGHAHDRCGAPVEASRQDRSRVVVVGVLGRDHAAAEAVAEPIDRNRLSGWGVQWELLVE
jgi:hypothetical protein